MQLRTRVLVGGGTMIALAATALGTHVLTRRAEPSPIPQVVVTPPAPTPAPVACIPEAEEPPTPPAMPTIENCTVPGLPTGYSLKLTAEQAASFSEFLRGWIADPRNHPPAIDYQRGVLYAESEEDRGDDGPYPRSAAPETLRVCGTPATWLKTSAALAYAASAIESCCGNVCSYSGMEYAPNGILIFSPATRDGETTWALDAWVEWYSATLPEETRSTNFSYVHKALTMGGGERCPGEPAGAY